MSIPIQHYFKALPLQSCRVFVSNLLFVECIFKRKTNKGSMNLVTRCMGKVCSQ